MMRFLLFTVLAQIACGRFLAAQVSKAPPAKPDRNGTVTIAAKSKAPPARTGGNATLKSVAVIGSNVSATSDVQRLSKLQDGLKAISKLRTMFQADHKAAGGSEFAEGALSNELSKQDSDIWGTIETMMTAASQAQSQLKAKDKAAQQKVMASLEKDLNDKAAKLQTGLSKVSEHQKQLDEEYVLGLLNMHKDWTMDQQLNATKKFMQYSPKLQQLFYHHNSKQPLAMQLAALMDANSTALRKAQAVQATKHAAAKLFLQLASSFKAHDPDAAEEAPQPSLETPTVSMAAETDCGSACDTPETAEEAPQPALETPEASTVTETDCGSDCDEAAQADAAASAGKKQLSALETPTVSMAAETDCGSACDTPETAEEAPQPALETPEESTATETDCGSDCDGAAQADAAASAKKKQLSALETPTVSMAAETDCGSACDTPETAEEAPQPALETPEASTATETDCGSDCDGVAATDAAAPAGTPVDSQDAPAEP